MLWYSLPTVSCRSFEHPLLVRVIKRTLATLYKKQVHIGALNVELFDAIQYASYLLSSGMHILTCRKKQPWINNS